jgi:putative sterol carrier protein
MVARAREFFRGLETRRGRMPGLSASYLFELGASGTWRVQVDDGAVSVSEGGTAADCVIATSEETFLAVVRGDESPFGAYLSGKIRVAGDAALALRLRELLA